ncbi:MAG: hypothetical protein J5I62_00940 [Flavobacteriales bacterium]|nr:hypothetical protein [Flavobacteriales bacterium]MEB2342718.1 hypothetical protein [Flavobacteriia bacterium]
MIKIFALFNLAGLLLFNMLFSSDVKVSQNLPAQMEPGTEVRVTVTINKAQINGFAKLQIDLPPGLGATAIETRGASFTFADGKAKFIWMALPTQPSFQVSYTLSADAQASGSFPIVARLSFIENNERKTVDAPPATIMIGTGVVASAPQTQTQATETMEQPGPEKNDLVSAAPVMAIPDAPVVDTPGLPAQTGSGNVGASRTVTQVGQTEYLVEVTIRKGALRGFGKLQENLPIGFSAIEKSDDDAIFSMQGRMLKFVWLNLPSKSELKVSYRLLAPEDAEGTYTLNGEFGYLLNDVTQRAVVGSTDITIDRNFEVARQDGGQEHATETTAAHAQEQKGTTATVESKVPTTDHSASGSTIAGKDGTARVTSTPAPETGIAYKVQITAAHREVGKPYFVERHRYSGDFSIEHHQGWIKYVTGNFGQYREARDRRQSYIDAQYNFPGPFVTAYNNGERITVQEALMISRQKWVQ